MARMLHEKEGLADEIRRGGCKVWRRLQIWLHGKDTARLCGLVWTER